MTVTDERPAPATPAALSVYQLASLTSGGTVWSTEAAGDIPAISMSDGPHGLRKVGTGTTTIGLGESVPATCFPPAVGLAASWNPELIEEVGRQLGAEATALGVCVLLGPALNIKRSPLGGRNFEYASEDPLVAGRYAAALVRGIQSTGVGATPKHFAVNNQETDRFRVSAQVDERALREIYLAGFEYTVTHSHPWALMSAYNQINGTYSSHSHWLLTEVLRGEWGFDGIVMSDWGAVWDRVAAVEAGLDLEMPPSGTDDVVAAAVASGELDPAVLETVAERLRVLAERTAPVRMVEPTDQVDVAAGDAIAYKAAVQSIVLLRNEGNLLPLEPQNVSRVAVIGELARTPRFQGGGSSHVVPTVVHDALSALTSELGAEKVAFAPGYVLPGAAGTDTPGMDALIADAISAATDADVALVFLGLPEAAESEGFDRTTLALPSEQIAALEAVIATGTPVAVVLSAGGVVDVAGWHERVGALVHGSLLGQAGGKALADVILGVASPSGHLTETFPLRLEDSPSWPTFPGRDRVSVYGESVFVGYRGFDSRPTPVAYPFGHGLTYTEFAYRDLVVEPQVDGSVQISFEVENIGQRPGAAVPQVYVAPPTEAQPTRPAHELRDFGRVELAPGEAQTVTVALGTRAFSLWDAHEHRWLAPAGQYTVEVGASSREILLAAQVDYPGDGYAAELTMDSTLGEWLDHPIGSKVLADATGGKLSAGSLPAEMDAMGRAMPLIKIAAFGMGLTVEMIEGWLAEVHQREAEGN